MGFFFVVYYIICTFAVQIHHTNTMCHEDSQHNGYYSLLMPRRG